MLDGGRDIVALQALDVLVPHLTGEIRILGESFFDLVLSTMRSMPKHSTPSTYPSKSQLTRQIKHRRKDLIDSQCGGFLANDFRHSSDQL